MSLKKTLFLISAMACASTVTAADVSTAGGLVLRDSQTSEMRVVTEADTESSKMMRGYVAPAEGADLLYDAYVNNGYLPLHAMMLANWDVSEGLRLVSPGIPENVDLKVKINHLRTQYSPK